MVELIVKTVEVIGWTVLGLLYLALLVLVFAALGWLVVSLVG